MRFRSTFVDADGRHANAVLEAPSEQRLHEQLHSEGRMLLRAKPVSAAETFRDAARVNRNTRIPPTKMLAFVQSLEGALDAGVPALQALDAIAASEDDEGIRAVYQGINEQVIGGKSFSDALAAYPRSFSPVLQAMIHAGESSGQLPHVLRSIAEWLEWRIDITATVRQAMVYPCVVLSAGYGLILLLLSFVIPSLAGILDKIGSELPYASRVLMDLSGFVAHNVLWVVVGTLVLIGTAVACLRTDFGRNTGAALLASMPVSGTVVRMFTVTQFCRNLSVLLDAGLTVTDALELSGKAVSLRRTREEVGQVTARIVGGHKLTDSLAEIDILPPLALSMVRVGEEAGRLPSAFARLSAMFDREVRGAVKRALAMLEPIVTVLLGIIVGGVAALVITTIYTAMKGLGR